MRERNLSEGGSERLLTLSRSLQKGNKEDDEDPWLEMMVAAGKG